MIFVHLFNTFCGVKMEGKWNNRVKNTYVYKCEKINVQENKKEMNFDKNALFGKAIGQMGSEIRKIINENKEIKLDSWEEFRENIGTECGEALYKELKKEFGDEQKKALDKLVEIVESEPKNYLISNAKTIESLLKDIGPTIYTNIHIFIHDD